MRRFALLLALALPCAAGVTLAPKGGVEEHQGAWSFVVEGATSLPDGARLNVEVYYLREFTLPSGEKDTQEFPIGDTKATVHDKTFRVSICSLPHAPFSTTYRARVNYDPSIQPADVTDAAPDAASKDADFREGRPEDLEREKAEADRSVAADMTSLHDLYVELDTRFKSVRSGPTPIDLKAWHAWRGAWEAKLVPIRESNKGRIEQDIYWRESYGKQYIDSMLEDLPELADFFLRVLEDPWYWKTPREVWMGAEKGFEDRYWQRLDYLGIVMIAHPKEVLSLLDEIEGRVKRVVALREAAAKKDPSFTRAAWDAQVEEARTAFAEAPARLSSELPETYFPAMTKLCRDLLSLLSAPEAAVDAAPILTALASLRKDAEVQARSDKHPDPPPGK